MWAALIISVANSVGTVEAEKGAEVGTVNGWKDRERRLALTP